MSRLASGRQITPGTRIGGGGEADVFEVQEDPKLALKRYRNTTRERHDKVTVMVSNPPAISNRSGGHIYIAWPIEASFTDGGDFEGFVMPRIDGANASPVVALYNPQTRHQTAPAFTWQYLLRTAKNAAIAVRLLHERRYVVGDLNESNILVNDTALVTVVDCDSMQVMAKSGRMFRSLVSKPEYTAPELIGRDLSQTDRTPASDNFALAVLVYHLLMEGWHPFAGIWKGPGEMPPLVNRIQRGLFALDGNRQLAPPAMGVPFSTLPPDLHNLFRNAFRVDRSPNDRPTAGQWSAALERVEGDLRRCDRNSRHLFGGHLHSCPWCERIRRLKVPDPFPGPLTQAPLPKVSVNPNRPPAKAHAKPPNRPTTTRPAPTAQPTTQGTQNQAKSGVPSTRAPAKPPNRPTTTRPAPTAQPTTQGTQNQAKSGVPPTKVPAKPPNRPSWPRLSWPRNTTVWVQALIAAALVIAATGIALMVSLQVENRWLEKEPAQRTIEDRAAMNHWGPVLGAGLGVLVTCGVIALPLLTGVLVRLAPSLRRTSRWRRIVLALIFLPLTLVGIIYVSPGMPAARVMAEQQIPNGSVTAVDNFSTTRGGWSARGVGSRGSVRKGTFNLVVKRPDAFALGISSLLRSRLDPSADIRVDVRASLRNSTKDSSYGVACRYHDSRHFYLVGLSDKGQYRVDKRLDDRWIQLQEWRSSKVIRPDGPNRIQVVCIGGVYGGPVMLGLWVNGERLTQVIDRGSRFRSSPTIASGSIALFARSHDAIPLNVAFDDLGVRTLDRTQLPFLSDDDSNSYRG
jgi:serine/threonine protein kinase